MEKVVSSVSRGWEEYKRKFPHLAHIQRHTWSESEWRDRKAVKAWLEGGDESRLEEREGNAILLSTDAQKREVETWLTGGGGRWGQERGGDVLSSSSYLFRYFIVLAPLFKGKQSQ